jgi:hypothetical protein
MINLKFLFNARENHQYGEPLLVLVVSTPHSRLEYESVRLAP